jgi:hypothetical protein
MCGLWCGLAAIPLLAVIMVAATTAWVTCAAVLCCTTHDGGQTCFACQLAMHVPLTQHAGCPCQWAAWNAGRLSSSMGVSCGSAGTGCLPGRLPGAVRWRRWVMTVSVLEQVDHHPADLVTLHDAGVVAASCSGTAPPLTPRWSQCVLPCTYAAVPVVGRKFDTAPAAACDLLVELACRPACVVHCKGLADLQPQVLAEENVEAGWLHLATLTSGWSML